MKNTLLFKCIGISFLLLIAKTGAAQPSLALTVSDLLNWQPSAVTPQNISTVPLSHRVLSPNYQIVTGLDTNARILYSPDGMNNFGPYIDSASNFNLFNFSHWQYIDILAWFGGSAGTPVIIPAKAWVDAAHKNGVKVIGTIFFAPTVYGGSQSQVQSFLVQDSVGNFNAAEKMIEIANYYNFDGWIINGETPVNSTTGNSFLSFMGRLDSTYNGELIWYDAMIQNGTVSYQNKLDPTNAPFFEHSTGLFTNYGWTSANTINSSHNTAVSLNLNPFKIYTGADMWPSRTNQPAFTDYTWIDQIFQSGVAKTSVALFATNFTYNYAPFSTFNTDSTAYNSFYSTERQIFSGVDQNPFTVDNNAWKGIGNYIAVRTPFTSLPFQTDFNTGHGLNYYNDGTILIQGSWSNMSHQSPLPSWTFYSNGVTMGYNFTDAYSGGSSINITSAAAGNYSIPLFSTNIITTVDLLNLELALKSTSTTIDSISIELKKKNSALPAVSTFHPSYNGNWEDLLNNGLAVSATDTLIEVVLNIHSTGAFNINIGEIGVVASVTASIKSISNNANSLMVYPNPSDGNVSFSFNGTQQGQLTIYDLKGAKVLSKIINGGEIQKIQLPASNAYLYEFTSGKYSKQGKLIVD